MAFCGSKLHHSHSSSSHCCQPISILWPEGTAGWLFELRERAPPAKQHAESAENLAFNKHIKSSPFVYGGGSLRLESYFLFHFAECLEVTCRFHSVLHRGVTEEDRKVTYGVRSAEQNERLRAQIRSAASASRPRATSTLLVARSEQPQGPRSRFWACGGVVEKGRYRVSWGAANRGTVREDAGVTFSIWIS